MSAIINRIFLQSLLVDTTCADLEFWFDINGLTLSKALVADDRFLSTDGDLNRK